MFKIAIFRALQLGDLLCAIPAIAALKFNYPNAKLYFIGLPHMRALMERFDCIDEYNDFPGHPALPEIPHDPKELARFILRMQAENYDLLVQMQGDGTIVNDFLTQFRARRLVGFKPLAAIGDSDWLTYPNHLHEVDRHLALVRFLGLEEVSRSMYYPIYPADWAAYEHIKSEIERPFVIVHVGSRDTRRRWPVKNFAYLSEYMYRMGYQVVLTGVKGEQLLVDELQKLMKCRAVNLCSRLDLGMLGCLLTEASLLLCNCTGISHIAAALQTKSIVISMDGEPQRWGPRNTNLHTTFDLTKPIGIARIENEINRLLPSVSF
ncbi:glycosyltransferase family 9 protein [Sphingobacterium sp. UBA5670]|uniref:glycosyltransferase family 9 protein n=1 Tax=Sphingobacterium sp. UBA5670 TaxID=1947502 RepID=UPI0025F81B24|nr:glycosyltransferase family 9 protein [Sphingobacterium sp. UBA5670]